jgi:hypothetical protein
LRQWGAKNKQRRHSYIFIYKEFYLYLDLDLKNSEEPMQRQPGARRFAAFF